MVALSLGDENGHVPNLMRERAMAYVLRMLTDGHVTTLGGKRCALSLWYLNVALGMYSRGSEMHLCASPEGPTTSAPGFPGLGSFSLYLITIRTPATNVWCPTSLSIQTPP